MNDEQDLLQRARDLDEQALTTIFDRYYRVLFHYVVIHIKQPRTAEDLTAEVFSRLLNALNKGRGPHQYLKAWLYRVAHNLIVDEVRARDKLPQTELDEDLQTRAVSVEGQVQASMMAVELEEALDHLTKKQRDVIMLKYLAGMDNADVARTLSLPVSAVKSLQHRGLAALRRHLQHELALQVTEEAT